MPARILVPFDDLGHLQETLCQATKVAERLKADLILLRVNLPPSRTTPPPCEEHLYSELKALQAQCTGCPTPIRIDAMAGPVEQAFVGNAAENKVVLILGSDIGQLTGLEKPRRAAYSAPRTAGRWMENALLAPNA